MAKILIVDDEPSVAEILCDCLTAEGYDTSTVYDGLNALRTMLDIRPDLVISDVMMPGMGGAPLLTAMHENAYLDSIPVIIMSGWPQQHVRDLCTGYAAFLSKPFPMSDMVATVRSLVEPGDARGNPGNP
jgi:DNA-binding response OmpR family regulator